MATPTGPPRNSLEERLRFETLLADLSARFVNLPADQVDTAIEDAQRQVCECLDLDLSLLWQMPPDHPDTMFLTHRHLPPGLPPLPEVWDCKESFPVGPGEIPQRRDHHLVPVDGCSRRSRARRGALCASFGVKSLVTIPLSTGGGPTFGALNFDCHPGRAGVAGRNSSTRLKLVALVFANALARKRDEQALRESEAQLRRTLEEVQRLRDRLQVENVYLREQLRRDDGHATHRGRERSHPEDARAGQAGGADGCGGAHHRRDGYGQGVARAGDSRHERPQRQRPW